MSWSVPCCIVKGCEAGGVGGTARGPAGAAVAGGALCTFVFLSFCVFVMTKHKSVKSDRFGICQGQESDKSEICQVSAGDKFEICQNHPK